MAKTTTIDLQTTDSTEFAVRAREMFLLLEKNGYKDSYEHTSHNDEHLSGYVGMSIVFPDFCYGGACFATRTKPNATYEDYFGLFNPFL